MGEVKNPVPVKIIAGLIASDEGLFNKAARLLSKKFGPVDIESATWPFDRTTYYQEEMGEGLRRKFLGFRGLAGPVGIERIKIFTNTIEKKFLCSGKRRINIDPGYITAGKLVLLTTKNYSHRIYLNKGIYAEVTLFFKNGDFQPWEWSYPDYKTHLYRDFFRQVRDLYMEQIK